MSIQQIIDAVKAAKREVDVLVESTEYYRRAGDTETKTITYVDADVLLYELQTAAIKKEQQP